MFLSCCGIATYRIFKGITAPAKSTDKKFSALVALMKDHQKSKRNPIAERFFSSLEIENQVKTYQVIWLMSYVVYRSIASMEISWKKYFVTD